MSTDLIKIHPLILGNGPGLFGVITRPHCSVESTGVIILNAGLLHNVGPFRLHVDLAMALAERGIASIRIDQSGKGESQARPGMSRYDSLLADYDDAMGEMQSIGVERSILIGLCSGADDSTIIASSRNNVAGLIMFDGYARKNNTFHAKRIWAKLSAMHKWKQYCLTVARRATKKLLPEKRVSSPGSTQIDIRDWPSDDAMVDRLSAILDNGIRVLTIFSAGQDYYNHLGQFTASLGSSQYASMIDEKFIYSSDHTYSNPDQRRILIEFASNWAGIINGSFGTQDSATALPVTSETSGETNGI